MTHEDADKLYTLYVEQGAGAVRAALADLEPSELRDVIVATLEMMGQTAKALAAVLADSDRLRGLDLETPPGMN